jgi:hypothetical protein
MEKSQQNPINHCPARLSNLSLLLRTEGSSADCGGHSNHVAGMMLSLFNPQLPG